MARKSFSKEFKYSAIRLVTVKNHTLHQASRNLGIGISTLRY